MADPFKDILTRGLRERIIPNKTKEARNWYRRQAMSYSTTPNQLMINAPMNNLKSRPQLGNMYMYWYDPKHKDKLPVYDMFPCIILYKIVDDGFYGLNLHYLGYQQRAVLMDALYPYVNDTTTYDEKTRFLFTYEILKKTYNLQAYKECIKRYLSPHVTSRFLYVPPHDWDTALFLPVERFNNSNYLRTKNTLGPAPVVRKRKSKYG